MILPRGGDLFKNFECRLNELTSQGSYICLDTNMYKAPMLSNGAIDLGERLGIQGDINIFKVYDALVKQRLRDHSKGDVTLVEDLEFEGKKYLSTLGNFLKSNQAVLPRQVMDELSVRIGLWDIYQNSRAIQKKNTNFYLESRNRFYGYNKENPLHLAVINAKTSYLSNLLDLLSSTPSHKIAEGNFGDDPDANVVLQARKYAREKNRPLMLITADTKLQNRIRSMSFGKDVGVCNEFSLVRSDDELFLRTMNPGCNQFAQSLVA